MSEHVVQWVTASPLWDGAVGLDTDANRVTAMRRPALLRFERDTFMDDAAAMLATDPASLAGAVATPVTYRPPAPGESAPPAPADLKLYQAVHGHFYLVAATLVCRLPGLPEHDVNTSAGERVSFVLRRVSEDSRSEWAWVTDAAAKAGKSWKLLGSGATDAIDPQEELMPLFPLRYTSGRRLRRLYVGLVPTASSDTYKAAGPLSPLSAADAGLGGPPSDPRPAALTAKVTDPLRALIAAQTTAPGDAPPDRVASIVNSMRAQQVEASSFLLLDFAEFLHDNLGWFAGDPSTPPTAHGSAALWALLAAPATQGGGMSWRDALALAWRQRLILSGDEPGVSSLQLNLHVPGLSPAAIDTAVAAALPPFSAPPAGTAAVSIQGDTVEPPRVPKLDAQGAARYLIRCVYRRPECCGCLSTDVVSAPSDEFRIAGFFDLDAPARSFTIAMPVDTSIKDLRKLKKNVSFVLSNELRSQMNRVTSLKDAMNGQFADGETLDIGLLCSFSVPIISICALIVLMIFINLLNIVFWWLPFLKICFPVGVMSDGD